MMDVEVNSNDNLKLNSQIAIGLAGFIGGPMAAGFLIRENYIAQANSKKGNSALIIGIVVTILIFSLLFLLPDTMVDKVPKYLIPFIYLGLIYLVVQKEQGEILKIHKENNFPFYSIWRAVLAGFVSLLLIIVGIFSFSYLSIDNDIYDKYDNEMAKFADNEDETLVFYSHLETKNHEELLFELENTCIPISKENLIIVKQLAQLENLPSDLIEHNKIIIRYSELRIEVFEIFRKAIVEDSDEYLEELEIKHKEIERLMDQLD